MKTFFLLLCLTGAAAAAVPADTVVPILRDHGIQDGSQELAAKIGRGATWYQAHLGKVRPGANLNADVSVALEGLGAAIRQNHLRGDQTIELLRDLAVTIAPKLAPAVGNIPTIAGELRPVPGTVLYSYILPGLREGIVRRLSGLPREHGGASMAEMQGALDFANQYHLHATQLVMQLRKLRLAVEEVDKP